ncbi:selenocysteine lyase/cysteine desulfurase [Duganella sp. 3397]|uniref:aminotransferase class V-fold PLP-dependent enzyme n=1 Tax=Duganella sp. 3397 TaxID=2817732 RepID=UPI00285B28A2|nr:aminotransferase class V-fold PLP-dependent enzyme [Duganella sp. 3397]MDR7047804.1 selenocysteine lyase/cysteine desulfurase [Duganella sp. 3397]
MTISRRTFLQGSVIAAGTVGAMPALHAQAQTPFIKAPAGPVAQVVRDEAYWREIRSHYDVSGDFINLENAYYGIMTRAVADDFKRHIDHLNRDNSYFLRREFDRQGIEAIRATLAQHLGVPTDEVALTRGATESLQNLISNYQLLKAGDTIMYGDLDYDSMQYAMNDLAARRGATVAMVTTPEPATRQGVLDAYEQALKAHPRTRLLLLTHISHRTGLVYPMAELVKMVKARGVDVIVDVAQSWGQLDYQLPDLQADFVGGNLHKWIGAPLGLGFIYIRKERMSAIGVHLGNADYAPTDIRARVLAGTVNAAALMTIPDALRQHDAMGTRNKGARLRHLRDHWVAQLRGNSKVQILAPDDMSGAVTSLRLAGKTSFTDNVALQKILIDQYGIFTVPRKGPAGGACLRVTPALFTTTAELDKFTTAIGKITT